MAFSRQYSQDNEDRQDVIRCLNAQRVDSELCDVILLVGNEKLPAHRCVLSASSHYFRSMFAQGSFAESSSTEVQLFSIDSGALKSILDMIYLGTLSLDLSNVYAVLEAADLMLMETVRKYCADFFTEILGSSVAMENVLYIRQASQMYSMDAVAKRCERFVAVNFPTVVKSDAFTALTLKELKHYISSDEIHLGDEEVFMNAAVRWILANKERLQYVDEIMSLVRFPLMTVDKLIHIVKPHSLMKSHQCRELVEEALIYHLQPLSQCLLQSPRTKPRITSTDERTVIYCISGVTDFRCYLPAFNRWYSLKAPSDFPDELAGKLSDRHHARLIAVRGFVYACIVEKTPEEVGNYSVKAILQCNINENNWKCCQLPSGSSGQCRFLEAHNVLFACSRDRIESYDEVTDTWETLLEVEITPCDFVVADDDWVHFFNLESGIAQSVLDLVNSQRKTTVRTQVMTPNRDKVLSVCKLSKNEVCLHKKYVNDVQPNLFLNINPRKASICYIHIC